MSPIIPIASSVVTIVVVLLAMLKIREYARSARGDATSAAAAARAAASSLAHVDTVTSTSAAQPIPPGAMPPTIPLDRNVMTRRSRQRMRENNSPRTSLAAVREIATPGAGADIPRAGGRAQS